MPLPDASASPPVPRPHVATLVLLADAESPRADDLLRRLAETLGAVGVRVGAPEWLAANRAVDLPFGPEAGDPLDDPALRRIESRVRAALEEAGSPFDLAVDLAVGPADGRRKRLLLADMESTVIANEMLDELAETVGAREKVAAITERAMRGELDFREALAERVALLADLPITVLHEVRSAIRVDPGAAPLVATMRAHGAECALVSGGFHVFADEIGADLGFDHVQANRLEVRGDAKTGRLTGRVIEPVLDRDAKLRALEAACARLGLDASAVAAVGDGANDLAMLGAAGLGVAYHGKPQVAAAARYRIDHGDLETLLYYQGYRDDEIVRP